MGNGWGGKRPGSGRKRGGANRQSREVADAVAVTGETPLAYMMSVLRDQNAEQARRDEMAKSAAPYVHPKLHAVAPPKPENEVVEVDPLREHLEEMAKVFRLKLTSGKAV